MTVTATGIKCGHCKSYHPSIDDVRNCRLTPEDKPPSTRSMSYLEDLIVQRPGCGLFANDCTTQQQASAMIKTLLSIPRDRALHETAAVVPTTLTGITAATTTPSAWVRHTDITSGVPKGRYCIDIDGTQKFFRWQKASHGRWKGQWFLNLQESDRFNSIPRSDWERIFKAIIMQDIDKSRIRYGKLLEHCGVCGKALTNKVSRDYGIGPECRGRYGFG